MEPARLPGASYQALLTAARARGLRPAASNSTLRR